MEEEGWDRRQWERLPSPPETPFARIHVPGGWIYRTVEFGIEHVNRVNCGEQGGRTDCVALCFVPDRDAGGRE